ncbi:hypothetical protein M2322_004830, partial [Rhodoblastus acidophilus]
RKQCRLTLGEISARAGVGVTTARNALRYAAREGLVTIEERRRDKRPNLSNVVRIVSREWTAWIARGRKQQTRAFSSQGGGCKKAESTDTASSRSSYGERASRVQISQNIARRPPNGDLRAQSK